MSEVLHYEMHDSTLAGIELEGADAVLIFASLAARTIDWEHPHDFAFTASALTLTWCPTPL